MSLGEFELIERYFEQIGAHRDDVSLGIGDDGAVVTIPDGREVVTVVRTATEAGEDGADLGARVADLAARDLLASGAEPAWITLALTLPRAEPDWLGRFATGLEGVCREHGMALVGGDTTRGQLTVTVVVHGLSPDSSRRIRGNRAVQETREPS